MELRQAFNSIILTSLAILDGKSAPSGFSPYRHAGGGSRRFSLNRGANHWAETVSVVHLRDQDAQLPTGSVDGDGSSRPHTCRSR
jgi:hypothetical protein